jgi:uncharacterized radical SAM superfamily Fe-S cluster-containing enzyme
VAHHRINLHSDVALRIALSINANEDQINGLIKLDEDHLYSIATKNINHLITLKEKEYSLLKSKFELQYNTFVNSLSHCK